MRIKDARLRRSTDRVGRKFLRFSQTGWILGVCHAGMSYETNSMVWRRLTPMSAAEVSSKMSARAEATKATTANHAAVTCSTRRGRCEHLRMATAIAAIRNSSAEAGSGIVGASGGAATHQAKPHNSWFTSATRSKTSCRVLDSRCGTRGATHHRRLASGSKHRRRTTCRLSLTACWASNHISIQTCNLAL
jgi:hypothetical protein